MSLPHVPDDILRMPSQAVTSAQEAFEIVRALEHQMSVLKCGVGLAAPQIGISKAVSVIKKDPYVKIYLINPQIVLQTDPFIFQHEQCLSYLGRSFNVPRYKTIRITHQDFWVKANPQTGAAGYDPSGLSELPSDAVLVDRESVYVYSQPVDVCGDIICIAIQHEIDHLLGITIPFKIGSIEDKEWLPTSNSVASKKIGRNEPCPCGKKAEGKPVKYKKCCGK